MSGEQIKPGYKRTEVGVIPEDWNEYQLVDATERISVGLATSVTKHYRQEGVPIIRNLNIKDGYFDDSDLLYLSTEFARDNQSKSAKGLDVLTVHTGSNLGQSCVLPEKFDGCQTFTTLITTPKKLILDSHFLCYHLSSFGGRKEMDRLQVGGGKGNLNTGDLKKYRIALGSKNEQRAIATALSDVDTLLAKLDQLIAKKCDLKQATMQQLLTGLTRLPGFSGEWEVKRLGDVLTEIGDGATPSTAKPGNFGGSIAWVVIEDIKDEIWTTRNTLTDAGLQSCAAKLWPIGTLIISTGATIGEVGIARTPLATKQGICGLVFDPKEATSVFMKYWFASNKSFLLAKAQGSSIKEVRVPTLVQFEVTLPKVTEQTAIATALSDMDAELAALEARRDKTRALKQGMMQKLLTGSIRLI